MGGGMVYHRGDATRETVKSRLDTYNTQTAPLIDYYMSQGKLKTVDGGTGAPDDIFAQIINILE